MIRINLSKTRIENAEALEQGGYTSATSFSSGSGRSNELALIVVKLVLLFGGAGGFYYHEGQHISELNQESMAANAQLQQLQTSLDQKNTELAAMGSAQGDSKVLEDKMKLLKKLSHLRLREVKSLDYIQTVIPVRAWITHLTVDKEEYNIKGRSKDATAVSGFMKKLDEGGFFSDVVLVKDSPVQNEGGGVREFEIIARSEVEN